MALIVSTRSNLQQHDNQANSYRVTKTAKQDLDENAQDKLANLLQTTIEIEPLFELFFGQMQRLLKLGSYQFINPTKGIQLKLGTKSAHNCDYSLNIKQQYLGNISFTRNHRFSEEELAQLENLLGTLVYPLRNALDYSDALNQALIDPLSSLGNRVALDNSLEHQWQMAQRYKQNLGVLMIDIDFFKKINDNYGHDIGDDVIKHVADSIKVTTRQTDMAFRYGGEEFLVLLNKTTILGSSIIAERIRENIENLSLVDTNGQSIKVTASIGGTHSKPGISKTQLIREADKALYIAKKQGRNCVNFYQVNSITSKNEDSTTS
jgi:diguanylate cyclase (GGDEF)-like protein